MTGSPDHLHGLSVKMTIQISRIAEPDIPGAITAIQKAFAEDPYNLWVYNDRSKVGF